ncbi:MAG: peptide chain release factor N(5)-glutamine methyltransferase [Pseudomonadota bacterium]
MSGRTLQQSIAAAAQRLEDAGVETPKRDAEVLLCHVLTCDRAYLIGHGDDPLADNDANAFDNVIAKREAREPVSQILGTREFWSLAFGVSRAVLSPRPETETLIEAVLDHIADRSKPMRLLDLGTGTGCLLLTLLHELPASTGIGVDASNDALSLARGNAERLALSDRAAFQSGDWADGLSGPFDIVASNPPYIETATLASLAPEVALWEPVAALDGGSDGLDAYRRIVPQLKPILADEGIAVLEHGPGQADAIAALASRAGLGVVERRRDLEGRERCLILKG